MSIRTWDTNLKVRLIGETINSILFWMYFPFLTLYFIDKFGEQLAGLLMIVPPLIGVFANLYGGYAADKYGRKKMMVLSLGLQAGLLVIFGFSPSAWIDYLAFIGLSILGSFYHPASMAMVADIVPVEERRPVFALFYMSVNIGVVIGPTIGAFFFFDYRRYLILASAIVTFIIFIIMLKALRETLPESAKEKPLDMIGQIKSYVVIFTDKVFFIFVLAGILLSTVFMQMDLLLGLYLRDYVPKQTINLNFTEITITGERLFGWLVSENGLVVVLFGALVTRFVKDWSDQKALVISSILFATSFWLMGFTTNAIVLMGLMWLFTIAELMRAPVTQNFVTIIAPEEKRGQYLGASSLQYSVGRAIAPLSITLTAYFLIETVFTIIFIIGLFSAVLYKIMYNIYNKELQNQI